MIVKMLTHMHMVVYTWWYWHICKGEGVGVETDQLSEETEAKQVTGSDRTLAMGAPARPVSGCGTGAEVDLMRRRPRPVMLTYGDVVARGTAVTHGSRRTTGLGLCVRS